MDPAQVVRHLLAWFAKVLADPEWIRAVGSLAWPSILFLCVVVFRPQIVSVAERLRKARGLGGELELDRAIEKAAIQLERAELRLEAAGDTPVETPSPEPTPGAGETPTPDPAPPDPAPPDPVPPVGPVPADPVLARDPTLETIYDVPGFAGLLAATPEQALMVVSSHIEAEIRGIAVEWGLSLRDAAAQPLTRILEDLTDAGEIPSTLLSAFGQFWEVRNAVVHDTTTSAQARSAVDLGASLLRLIRGVRLGTGLLPNAAIHATIYQALSQAFHPRMVISPPVGEYGPDFVVRAGDGETRELGVSVLAIRTAGPSTRAIRKACTHMVSWMKHRELVAGEPIPSGQVVIALPDRFIKSKGLQNSIRSVLDDMGSAGITVMTIPNSAIAAGSESLARWFRPTPQGEAPP